jgi:hypothetical protein
VKIMLFPWPLSGIITHHGGVVNADASLSEYDLTAFVGGKLNSIVFLVISPTKLLMTYDNFVASSI